MEIKDVEKINIQALEEDLHNNVLILESAYNASLNQMNLQILSDKRIYNMVIAKVEGDLMVEIKKSQKEEQNFEYSPLIKPLSEWVSIKKALREIEENQKLVKILNRLNKMDDELTFKELFSIYLRILTKKYKQLEFLPSILFEKNWVEEVDFSKALAYFEKPSDLGVTRLTKLMMDANKDKPEMHEKVEIVKMTENYGGHYLRVYIENGDIFEVTFENRKTNGKLLRKNLITSINILILN